MLNIFVGYDSSAHLAYQICAHSLVRRSSLPVRVFPVNHRALRFAKLFDRPWRIAENGQPIDERDDKPFSTEFSHSRFLVPELGRINEMKGHALFVDGDFLFLDDVAKLVAMGDDHHAIKVVKHKYAPLNTVKMDEKIQVHYQKKLWSSLILFNLDHPANLALRPEEVNHKEGSWLHSFGWLENEFLIGDLPEEWNWIPDHSSLNERIWDDGIKPKAIHYTEGGPWLDAYHDCTHAKEWFMERDHFFSTIMHNPNERIHL